MARDLTDRTEAARRASEAQLRQAERMERVGQLAGGVAHDFNYLLSAMMGYVGFLADGTADLPDLNADVEQLEAVVQRAADLVRQLLVFSRRAPGKSEPANLDAVIEGTRDLLSASLGGISLRVTSGRALPLIMADHGQLEQVLVNLAVNARDAMPDGGTVTIGTREAELTEVDAARHHGVTSGRYVELEVSDTGTGMSPEVAGRIFEPFFTIHVPATSRAPASTGPAAVQGSGEMILVVDDEPTVLAATSRMLRQEGYAVCAAGGRDEAMAKASEYDFQLLLTDTVIADITGSALATRIRQMKPGIRVLHMSGYAAGDPGADEADPEFIQKPFTAAALTAKVRAALSTTPA